MAMCRLPGYLQRLYTYMHQKLHMSELAIVASFLCLPILMGAPLAIQVFVSTVTLQAAYHL